MPGNGRGATVQVVPELVASGLAELDRMTLPGSRDEVALVEEAVGRELAKGRAGVVTGAAYHSLGDGSSSCLQRFDTPS